MHPIYEVRVLLILVLTHVLHKRLLIYGALEYLPSNSKNIKESLRHMTNYIRNKNIKPNKVNNVPDLKGVGKAAWNFILALYNSGWDSLVSDKDNHSF